MPLPFRYCLRVQFILKLFDLGGMQPDIFLVVNNFLNVLFFLFHPDSLFEQYFMKTYLVIGFDILRVLLHLFSLDLNFFLKTMDLFELFVKLVDIIE